MFKYNVDVTLSTLCPYLAPRIYVPFVGRSTTLV